MILWTCRQPSRKVVGAEVDHVEPPLGVVADRIQIGRQVVSVALLEFRLDLGVVAERLRPPVERLVLIGEHVVQPRDALERGQRLLGLPAHRRGILGRVDARWPAALAAEAFQRTEMIGDDHPARLRIVEDRRLLGLRPVRRRFHAREAVGQDVVDRVAQHRLGERSPLPVPAFARRNRRELRRDGKEVEPLRRRQLSGRRRLLRLFPAGDLSSKQYQQPATRKFGQPVIMVQYLHQDRVEMMAQLHSILIAGRNDGIYWISIANPSWPRSRRLDGDVWAASGDTSSTRRSAAMFGWPAAAAGSHGSTRAGH